MGPTKNGLHIGVDLGNMFLQITNGAFWGFLSKNGSKTPVNGPKRDGFVLLQDKFIKVRYVSDYM